MVIVDPAGGNIKYSYTCACGKKVSHRDRLPGQKMEVPEGNKYTLKWEGGCVCGRHFELELILPLSAA
jgi:hypothetical protein